MPDRRCPSSGKRCYSDLNSAGIAASALGADLIQRGQLARHLYAYRCHGCRSLHLTRNPPHGREQKPRVYRAPEPREQFALMPEHLAAEAHAAWRADGALLLPDPQPEPIEERPVRRYANRPRNLRRQR